MPNDLKPIDDFDLDRYLGEWYEIARLDHSFERGLYDVRANYALRADGGIEVKNFGVLSSGRLKEATGKAYFIGQKNRVI